MRESSPELEFESADDEVLEKARRTRLPTGSLSPEKQGSPAPMEGLGLGVVKTTPGEVGKMVEEIGGKEVVSPSNCKLLSIPIYFHI